MTRLLWLAKHLHLPNSTIAYICVYVENNQVFGRQNSINRATGNPMATKRKPRSFTEAQILLLRKDRSCIKPKSVQFRTRKIN